MLFRSLCTIFNRNIVRNYNNIVKVTFSRKANNIEGPYRVIGSKRESNQEEKEHIKLAQRDLNFELLAPNNGFPFLLPGNVGIAWYDLDTSLTSNHDFIMENIDDVKNTSGSIICRIQECPTVLRKTVSDLFPYKNLESADLSVITILLKPDLKSLRRNSEVETERLAQTFLITAKNVCDKLRNAGYWADFINPFSGRPYIFPNFDNNNLYQNDEKFRCLDFQIIDIRDCKVISNEEEITKKLFIGSLFTNAASKKTHLNTIFASK